MNEALDFTLLALNETEQTKTILDDVSRSSDIQYQNETQQQAFLERLLEHTVDLIILDTAVGIECVLKTLETMHLDSTCHHIPLCIIAHEEKLDGLVAKLEGFNVISIMNFERWAHTLENVIALLKVNKHRVQSQNESLDYAQSQNSIDPLTGALNRLGAQEKFESLVGDYAQRRLPFSIIMFDIDFFKKINDTHGHDVGDEILVSVSALISHNIRKDDALVRFGGEEFIVFLSAGLDVAIDKAEGFRAALESKLHGLDRLNVTASFGVTQYSEGMNLDALVQKVDALLYKAKNEGRNKVVYA